MPRPVTFILKRIIQIILTLISILILSLVGSYYYYFPKGPVVLELIGGVGNQLYQYAAAYSLAKSTDRKLYVLVDPKSEKMGTKLLPTERHHTITQFNLPPENIIRKTKLVKKLMSFLVPQDKKDRFISVTSVAEENFMSIKNSNSSELLWLFSNFESEIFFVEYKDEIRKILDLDKVQYVLSIKKDKEQLVRQLQRENSVCVHVRRGDYGEEYYMPISFQKKAMELAQKTIANPQFYVFSDEIEQVKYELGESDNITYVSKPDSFPMEDLFLLSKCANNINANSTFSWWASYLNKKNNRLVIHPFPATKNLLLDRYADNQEGFYVRKSMVYGTGNYPANWVLLAYKQSSLSEVAKNIISDEKYKQIFKDYKAPLFNIYSGDLAQLNLCEKDSDFGNGLCFMNGNSPKPTVVTAYYQIPNKYGHDKYIKWAENFLSIPFNLVVFTDKENASWIKKMRGNLPIRIIEKERAQFYNRKFSKIYERDLAKDADKHSVELYMIWAEKVKFVNEAIDKNPYNSNHFVWCDIGAFRESEYVNNNFTSAKYFINGQMSVLALQEFTLKEMAEKLMTKGAVRVGGTVQLGDIATWRVYNEVWDLTRDNMMEDGITASNDQRVIGTIALRYPNLMNLVYIDLGYKAHSWWYLLEKYKN